MQVTAMLGHHRPPQRGFQDWRGKGVKGMHTVICDLVGGRLEREPMAASSGLPCMAVVFST